MDNFQILTAGGFQEEDLHLPVEVWSQKIIGQAGTGKTQGLAPLCPDHPDNAGPFRKPAPGMVLKLLEDLNGEPAETWFVGDSLSDVECALNAGCKPALVLTGKGRDTVAKEAFQKLTVPVFGDLAQFVDKLLDN